MLTFAAIFMAPPPGPRLGRAVDHLPRRIRGLRCAEGRRRSGQLYYAQRCILFPAQPPHSTRSFPVPKSTTKRPDQVTTVTGSPTPPRSRARHGPANRAQPSFVPGKFIPLPSYGGGLDGQNTPSGKPGSLACGWSPSDGKSIAWGRIFWHSLASWPIGNRRQSVGSIEQDIRVQGRLAPYAHHSFFGAGPYWAVAIVRPQSCGHGARDCCPLATAPTAPVGQDPAGRTPGRSLLLLKCGGFFCHNTEWL